MTETHISKSIIASLDQPVVLVGMMGSGKSTLGAALARALGLPFFDSDKVIEDTLGKTIPEIFETEGDAAFRQHEYRTLSGLLAANPRSIIATGGGSITIPETADMIFGRTLSLWVDAPLSLLVDRTSRQNNRPILRGGDPRKILGDLLEKRTPIYRRATLHVESAEIPVEDMVERSLRQIADYLVEGNS